jgi:hypothetical protein
MPKQKSNGCAAKIASAAIPQQSHESLAEVRDPFASPMFQAAAKSDLNAFGYQSGA